MFVLVEQAHCSKSFGQYIKTDSLDPLDLSQNASLDPEPEQHRMRSESIAESSIQPTKSQEPCTTELQQDRLITPVPPESPSMSSLPSPLSLCSETDLDAAEKLQDDEKPCPAGNENSYDGNSDDGKLKDGESDTGNDNDMQDGDISEKAEEDSSKRYAALLLKYQKQTDKLKQIQKRYEILKKKHAEMKDLFIYTVAETKKAKMDPNSSTSFTADPDIDISVDRIQEINNMSKSVGNFAQNLAITMYGAANLRNRSVTGKECNRMKGAVTAKPGLSPKKLKFIYAKARERVELEVGPRNSEQIALLADKTIVNRAIAEKIANLRKATKNATGDDKRNR